MKKKIVATVITCCLSASTAITSFAGSWEQQENGQWRYQNEDGGFATGWINDNGKSYFLGDDGIMLTDTTTPDGYYVGSDGAWDGLEKPDGSFYSASGSGDSVIDGLNVSTHSYLKINHSGEGHFSIWGHYGDRSYDKDLFVNTSDDSYSGNAYLTPGRQYTLEISCTGDWEVKAYDIGTSDTDSFSGHGDWVSPKFIPSSSVYEINAPGDGHFSIWGVYGDRSYDKDLLVNTTDSYSGTVMFKHNSYSFFIIDSERDWSISPK